MSILESTGTIPLFPIKAININDPLAYIVQNDEDIEEAFQFFANCTCIAIDTETNWTDSFEDRKLMGYSLFSIHPQTEEKRCYYFSYRADTSAFLIGTHNLPIEGLNRLQTLFDSDSIAWIYHHAKFDMRVFRRDGIEPSTKFYDTMLMSHMINEIGAGVSGGPHPFTDHKLKHLAVKHISADADKESKMITKVRKSIPWEQIPIEVMGKYACKDAELTYYLYQYFEPKLRQQELDHLWDKERQFSMLLGSIEDFGIGIDPPVAKKFADEAAHRMQEILTLLGYDPAKPSQLAHRLYGDKNSGGLGLIPVAFSKRLSKEAFTGPDGKSTKLIPIMNRDNLSSHDIQEVSLVLEYRSLQKAHSTWFLGFLEKIDSHNRLHPTYKQHGTVTTRLSCENPNMQQLPRRKEEELEEGITNAAVKAMLRPLDNHELWEFDVSQAEFRLAAIYGEETEILEAYREGTKDFHQITADKLGIPRVAYDGTKREGKTLNFSMLYGAGPAKLAQMLKIGTVEASALHSEFWQEYPKLRDAVGMATMAAQARGWVRLWTGRKRHFQNGGESHKAFNSLIQGGVAEILKESMLRIDKDETLQACRMIAQVHDSLWFEIPHSPSEEEGNSSYTDRIKSIMEWPKESFPIPFPVDMKRIA